MSDSDPPAHDQGQGVVQEFRDNPIDIVVSPADGLDVFIKVGGDVLLLDRDEARMLADEIKTKLENGGDCQ